MTLVEQHINGWAGWPDDVVERLIVWNRDYLLSFPRTGNFVCGGGCGRWIRAHPNGNARLRPTKKAKATAVCEDCLTAIARHTLARHQPGPPDLNPHRAALAKERGRRERLLVYLDRLEQHHGKLHRQIAHDQLVRRRVGLQGRVSDDVFDGVRKLVDEYLEAQRVKA
jgi:hypothetical protein